MKPFEYIRLISSVFKTHEQQKIKLDGYVRELAFLIPHVRENIVRYIKVFFLLLLCSALSLPGPAITGTIIDKVFVNKDAEKLNILVGVLLAILIIMEFARLWQEYSMMRLSQEFTYSIRIKLIERILRYPMSFFNSFQSGYLVSRLDEANLLGNYFSITILSLGENIVRFIGAVFLISRYNIKLTLISMIVLPFYFEVARRSRGAIRITSMRTMEKNAMIRGKIQETLSGIELVKTYAKESRETTEIKSGLRSIIKLEIIQNMLNSVSGKILGVLTSANLLLILWVGGHEIIAGRLTVGQYIALVAYIAYLYGPIQMFVSAFMQFQRIFAACRRISEFLNKTAEDERIERTFVFQNIKGGL